MKIIILAIIMLIISPALSASQSTGKIVGLAFFGSGAGESIFVTMDSSVTQCSGKNRYIMKTKDRPAITSALVAAFHAQTTVTITGTGKCHASWIGDEEIYYAGFSR